MNAFEKHGIKHLSPSSVNCWRETPGLWTLRYLAGIRDESSPAALRGTAVEKGVELLLRGKKLDDAIITANHDFDAATLGVLTDESEAERALIEPMIKQAQHCLKAITPLPPIAATQLKVETYLDGVSVPVIGYVDFTFMEGADVDCKTTKRLPSEPRPDHLRQIALYHRARGRPGALMYVSDKRFAFYEPPIEDLRGALDAFTQAAQSLERFLSAMPDATTAIRCMPMATDHWSFGEKTKAALPNILMAG